MNNFVLKNFLEGLRVYLSTADSWAGLRYSDSYDKASDMAGTRRILAESNGDSIRIFLESPDLWRCSNFCNWGDRRDHRKWVLRSNLRPLISSWRNKAKFFITAGISWYEIRSSVITSSWNTEKNTLRICTRYVTLTRVSNLTPKLLPEIFKQPISNSFKMITSLPSNRELTAWMEPVSLSRHSRKPRNVTGSWYRERINNYLRVERSHRGVSRV